MAANESTTSISDMSAEMLTAIMDNLSEEDKMAAVAYTNVSWQNLITGDDYWRHLVISVTADIGSQFEFANFQSFMVILRMLSHLPVSLHLDVSTTQDNNLLNRVLAEMVSLPNLTTLVLQPGQKGLKPPAIERITRLFPDVTLCSITNSWHVVDSGLDVMASNWTKLKELHIDGCSMITGKGIVRLVAAASTLVTITFDNNPDNLTTSVVKDLRPLIHDRVVNINGAEFYF